VVGLAEPVDERHFANGKTERVFADGHKEVKPAILLKGQHAVLSRGTIDSCMSKGRLCERRAQSEHA
jgi:hypothetical protein